MTDLLIHLGYSDGIRRAAGPCTGQILGSARVPWTAYQRRTTSWTASQSMYAPGRGEG